MNTRFATFQFAGHGPQHRQPDEICDDVGIFARTISKALYAA